MPVELAVLLDQVEDTDWIKSDDPLPIAQNQQPFVTVTNAMQHPLLRGRLLVVSKEPVPWAWAHAEDEVKIPSLAVFLDIQCSDD